MRFARRRGLTGSLLSAVLLSAVAMSVVAFAPVPTAQAQEAATTVTGWSTKQLTAAVGYPVRRHVSVTAGSTPEVRHLKIQRRSEGGSWRTVSAADTAADGSATIGYSTPRIGRWKFRLVVEPTPDAARAVTQVRTVDAVAGAPTSVSGWTSSFLRIEPRQQVAGRVKVTTGGGVATRQVLSQRRRLRAGVPPGPWKTISQHKTTSRGRLAWSFRAPAVGKWHYRLAVVASRKAVGTTTSARTIKVFTPVKTPVVDFSAVEEMFTDAEPQSVILSPERRFNVNRVVRVRPMSVTRIEIANFAPIELQDVTVSMSIAGGPQHVAVATVSTFRAHGITTLDYPFLAGDHRARTTDGAVVDLSAYAAGVPADQVTFDFSSRTGAAKALADLDAWNWQINWTDFDPANNTGDNWQSGMTPRQARLYTGFIIDYAVAWNAPGFEGRIVAEQLTDDAGTLLTAEEKHTVYTQLHSQTYNVGIVENVAGLGGGNTFGVADWVLTWFFQHLPDGTTPAVPISEDVFPHETGHKLGYGHSSNMTYGNAQGSFTAVSSAQLQSAWDAGVLPITATNYYQPSDWK